MINFHHDEDLFITFNYEAEGIKVINSHFIPTTWTFNSEILMPTENFDKGKFQYAFEKCLFWLDNFFSDSIFFGKENTWAYNAFLLNGFPIGNNVVITPDDPDDHLIAMLVQSKINAIADGGFILANMDVKASPGENMAFHYIGNAFNSLPDITTWVDKKYPHKLPWWGRNDTSTYDIIYDIDKIDEWPDFKSGFDLIDQQFESLLEKQSAKIIKKNFKPTLKD